MASMFPSYDSFQSTRHIQKFLSPWQTFASVAPQTTRVMHNDNIDIKKRTGLTALTAAHMHKRDNAN